MLVIVLLYGVNIASVGSRDVFYDVQQVLCNFERFL